jgi:hypothetical protein
MEKSKPTVMEIKIEAYEVIEKTVARGTNTTGRVYLPKEWIGKRVKVFLMEPLEK